MCKCKWQSIETAPRGELVLLWSEITRGEPFIGDWAEYARYNHPQFTHWSRWDGLPPTSAEGVEHAAPKAAPAIKPLQC